MVARFTLHASRSTQLDSSRPRRLLRRFGQRHLEHAVFERCIARAHVNALWKRNGAIEVSVASLTAVVAFLVVFDIAVPLAADDERVIVDLDADIFTRQSRKVGANDEVVSALKDLDLRRP